MARYVEDEARLYQRFEKLTVEDLVEMCIRDSGITEGNIEDANVDSVGGKVLTADEKKQRQALIAEINDKAVSYTHLDVYKRQPLC